MSANFFSQALRDAIDKRQFNQAQLAEYLNVDPAYVSRWLKGSSPRIDQMRAVLSKLGWNIERAHPDYNPFDDALKMAQGTGGASSVQESPASYETLQDVKELLEDAAYQHEKMAHAPVQSIGRVIAADGKLELEEPTEEGTYEAAEALFPRMKFADTEVFALVVEGDDLAEIYPEGSWLFVRKVLKATSVPDGHDVFLESSRKPGVVHLRRLVRMIDKKSRRIERIIGAPLSSGHNYVFYKPREVRLQYVVVGVMMFPA